MTNDYNQDITLLQDIPEMSPITIHLPDPPNENKIDNYNLPQSSQVWHRSPMLKTLYQMQMTLPREELSKRLFKNKRFYKEEWAFMEEQWKRITQGYFIWIDWKIEWLPPKYYFYVNNWKMDVGYPEFRFPDKDIFIFCWEAQRDNECLGVLELTKMRDGKSFRSASMAYHESITKFGRFVGIQSKTKKDADSLFQNRLVQPWRALAFYYQPVCANSTNPAESLIWEQPALKGQTVMDKIQMGERAELAGWIQARHAGELAFDGEKLHWLLNDESGKVTESNVYTRWETNKKRLVIDGKKIGFSHHPTTVEDMEQFGGQNYKDLWTESDHAEITETGTTKSRLWRYFKPAYVGYYRDKFGHSIREEEAKARMIAERKQKEEDVSKLIILMRKEPFTPREAFAYAGKGNQFNIRILEQRIYQLERMRDATRRGFFKWKDDQPAGIRLGDPNKYFHPGSAEWIDDPNGNFYVSYLFTEPREASKFYLDEGVAFPVNGSKFVSGGDPFKSRTPKTNKPSLGGGAGFYKYDPTVDKFDAPLDTWQSCRFIWDYAHRPLTEYIYAEDMLMACVYYGSLMFPEINVDLLENYFNDRGFGGYLMYRISQSGKIDKRAGAHTNTEIQEEIFTMFRVHIQKHGLRERHINILKQCMEIDGPDDMTSHDLFTAAGYGLLGTKKVFIPEDTQEEKEDFGKYFPTYNYEHGQSVLR